MHIYEMFSEKPTILWGLGSMPPVTNRRRKTLVPLAQVDAPSLVAQALQSKREGITVGSHTALPFWEGGGFPCF